MDSLFTFVQDVCNGKHSSEIAVNFKQDANIVNHLNLILSSNELSLE